MQTAKEMVRQLIEHLPDTVMLTTLCMSCMCGKK